MTDLLKAYKTAYFALKAAGENETELDKIKNRLADLVLSEDMPKPRALPDFHYDKARLGVAEIFSTCPLHQEPSSLRVWQSGQYKTVVVMHNSRNMKRHGLASIVRIDSRLLVDFIEKHDGETIPISEITALKGEVPQGVRQHRYVTDNRPKAVSKPIIGTAQFDGLVLDNSYKAWYAFLSGNRTDPKFGLVFTNSQNQRRYWRARLASAGYDVDKMLKDVCSPDVQVIDLDNYKHKPVVTEIARPRVAPIGVTDFQQDLPIIERRQSEKI